MKNNLVYSLILMSMFMFTSCTAIQGIFKAGMWWAFFLVFVVIAVIVFILSKIFKK